MILRNARYERFALGLAEGLSQHAAYVQAGFSAKGARANATKLLQRDTSILRRRDELLSERETLQSKATAAAAAELSIDKAWVLAELVANVERAKKGERPDLSAANRALELIGKELGMFIDRKEIRTGPLSHLTDEQLDQLISAIESGLPANAVELFGRPTTH